MERRAAHLRTDRKYAVAARQCAVGDAAAVQTTKATIARCAAVTTEAMAQMVYSKNSKGDILPPKTLYSAGDA